MKLNSILVPETIIFDLRESTRDGVFRRLAEVLSAAGYINPENIESLVNQLRRREELGPTAPGHGFAVPYAKTTAVEAPRIAAAILDTGVDFFAPDSEPVDLVILVLCPPDRPGDFMRILGNVSGALRNEHARAALRAAVSPEKFLEVMTPFFYENG